jgi:hypothetical protein
VGATPSSVIVASYTDMSVNGGESTWLVGSLKKSNTLSTGASM